MKEGGVDALRRLIAEPLYDIRELISNKKILTGIQPAIIVANQGLLLELKKRPEDVYKLPPRKFEELLAEILHDLGVEVELTQETHDGGRDILAHMDTPCGRVLCLVDAKKKGKGKAVGVEMVRQLYGTLNHYKANSAMLVTTSHFSKESKQFQAEHKYELNLREYTDVVKWIDEYKQKTKLGLYLPG